jgi:hypothetical protein
MSTQRDTSQELVIPQPSTLPPNPSVGEIMTEIDRARHDMARTVNELVGKLDVKAAVQRKAHHQVESLRWNGRRMAADLREIRKMVLESVPPQLAGGLAVAGQSARKVPPQAWVAIVLLLLRRRRRNRRRKH